MYVVISRYPKIHYLLNNEIILSLSLYRLSPSPSLLSSLSPSILFISFLPSPPPPFAVSHSFSSLNPLYFNLPLFISLPPSSPPSFFSSLFLHSLHSPPTPLSAFFRFFLPPPPLSSHRREPMIALSLYAYGMQSCWGVSLVSMTLLRTKGFEDSLISGPEQVRPKALQRLANHHHSDNYFGSS